MQHWRWLVGIALAIALAAGFSSPLFAQAKPEKVTIAYQVIPNEEIIAKALGWHEKALGGVKVEWRQFDSGRDVNTAMASGGVDIGLTGSSPAAIGISSGIPYEVIWLYDVIGDNEALVVRKGKGIEKVADLAGKKVAAPFGSTTHYHLLVAMKEFGLDPKKATVLDMQPPDMLAAWTRGDIDAGFVWEPTLIKMLESGGEVLVSSRALAEKGYLTADVAVVRKDFARKYPQVVATYVKTLSDAVELFREKPQEAARAVAKEFNISEAEALRQMKTMTFLTAEEHATPKYLQGGVAKALKDAADFLVSQKTIRSAPDLATFQKAVVAKYAEMAAKK
jgi:taurine transport system substrate-binding protein